jgi:ribose 5-phosphate isomerase B
MRNPQTIAIGCDHAGYEYKEAIKGWLAEREFKVLDYGTHSPESVDYPDFVHPVAEKVESGDADLGIVICGSGNGVAMTANKHRDIRAAVAWKTELAALARQHNDANVLALPSRFVDQADALDMVRAFLEAEFEGGRHQGRVRKIAPAR